MKRKRIIPILLCLALALTACGGSSKNTAAVESPGAAPREEAAAMDMSAAGGLTEYGTPNSTPLPEGRKWVITMDMNVETEDLDTLMETLSSKIQSLGGYVEDQNIHNGSNYTSRRYRNANLTVRIPDEKVDSFTQEVADFANVVSQNLRREDITLTYVSTASRVTALETEEARLLELLAQAETMADLLEIEARLTDVRYELENHASQLRLYDNQVDYATIYLYIDEVQEYTPVEEPTFLERIGSGFRDSVDSLADLVVDLVVLVVAGSPYWVCLVVLFFLVRPLVKRIQRRKFRKQDPKA